MEIVRLTAKDYGQWLTLINGVFTRKNNRPMDFEKEIPKMCVADDAHMGKHLAVVEDGKLCSVVGIYPFCVSVCGRELLFATVGNMATLPEYEGRGYMSALYTRASEELKALGVIAARLGGNRQRYNRFGYESCGSHYCFTLNDSCRRVGMAKDAPVLRFQPVSPTDEKVLSCIDRLHSDRPMHVLRRKEDGLPGLYKTLTIWKNVPMLALGEDGSGVGFFVVSPDGRTVSDVCGEDDAMLQHILYRWQEQLGDEITFWLPPWDGSLSHFLGCNSGMTVASPSHFKILNYEKLADALMKLQRQCYPHLPDGQLVAGIEGYGNIRLYARGENAGCEKTEEKADIILDHLSAERFLFGPVGPRIWLPGNAFAACWLPLPLSWNTLDRT